MSVPLVWSPLTGKPRDLWLWGAFHDLFWIAGGASILFALCAVPVSLAWPDATMRLVSLFMVTSLVCNFPHYAATYAMVYRERARNPASWNKLVASVPIFVGLLCIGGTHVDAAVPLVLRVYFTWSAYHYGAQHFGLASMYSARGGAALESVEKRGLQIAFVAVAFFQMLLLNSASHSAVRSYLRPPEDGPESTRWLTHALFPASSYYVVLLVFALGVASFVAVTVRRVRAGRPLPLPVFLLFATHVVWFVLPNLRLRAQDPPWTGPIGDWIPAAIPFFHCAQYLGVIAWRARTSGPVRPVLLGASLMIVGWLLFDGLTAVSAAAFSRPGMQMALVTGLVNIHHFWMDGLIWRKQRMPALAHAQQVSVA